MHPLSQVAFGCQWDPSGSGHVRAWPLRLAFAADGPEITLDALLEGAHGHSFLLLDQLLALVAELAEPDTPIELINSPPGLAHRLHVAGYLVALQP
jgi:hypothetical protein